MKQENRPKWVRKREKTNVGRYGERMRKGEREDGREKGREKERHSQTIQ